MYNNRDGLLHSRRFHTASRGESQRRFLGLRDTFFTRLDPNESMSLLLLRAELDSNRPLF